MRYRGPCVYLQCLDGETEGIFVVNESDIPLDVLAAIKVQDSFARGLLASKPRGKAFISGGLELSNLQTLCRSCNSKKGVKIRDGDS